jgi:hypothetical protein
MAPKNSAAAASAQFLFFCCFIGCWVKTAVTCKNLSAVLQNHLASWFIFALRILNAAGKASTAV